MPEELSSVVNGKSEEPVATVFDKVSEVDTLLIGIVDAALASSIPEELFTLSSVVNGKSAVPVGTAFDTVSGTGRAVEVAMALDETVSETIVETDSVTREVDKLKLVLGCAAAAAESSLVDMAAVVLEPVPEGVSEAEFDMKELEAPRPVLDGVAAVEVFPIDIVIGVLVSGGLAEAGDETKELGAPRSVLDGVAASEVSFMDIGMLILAGILVSAGRLAIGGIDSVTGVTGVLTLVVDAAATTELLLIQMLSLVVESGVLLIQMLSLVVESGVLGKATVTGNSEVISELSTDVADPAPVPAPVPGPV